MKDVLQPQTETLKVDKEGAEELIFFSPEMAAVAAIKGKFFDVRKL